MRVESTNFESQSQNRIQEVFHYELASMTLCGGKRCPPIPWRSSPARPHQCQWQYLRAAEGIESARWARKTTTCVRRQSQHNILLRFSRLRSDAAVMRGSP